MQRREFLKSAGLLGTSSLLKPDLIFGSSRQSTAPFFDLHPFVAAHPEAIFIKRTSVSEKTATQEKLQAGLELAQELFVTSDDAGMPMGSRIAFKPNLTCQGSTSTPLVDRMSLYTDSDFVEGVIEGMAELGLQRNHLYMREGNLLGDSYGCVSTHSHYVEMAERTGAHLTNFDSGRNVLDVALANLEEEAEVIWREVPDGVIFNHIGYVAPFNADDAFNINISKLKAHGMGITLCSKNWQGSNVHPYIHYCESLSKLTRGKPASVVANVQPDFKDSVTALHARHLEAGVPRWDRPGSDWNSGWGMEGWAQKTLDNLSASNQGISIIEGIYGRDGYGQDFMTNLLVFGKNPIKVDIVGHWLAGHEPGNFGLFHSAQTRGLTNTVNPHEIPLYDWESGQPVRVPLDGFERTPLVTYYLQRDYDGQTEGKWHMVDEPYDYPPTAVLAETDVTPQSFVLGNNYPNPFNASTLIEYRLPVAGNARIEIYNAQGQLVDVLVDSWHAGGAHVATWDAGQRASGTYFYRFMTEGFQEARKMLLVR